MLDELLEDTIGEIEKMAPSEIGAPMAYFTEVHNNLEYRVPYITYAWGFNLEDVEAQRAAIKAIRDEIVAQIVALKDREPRVVWRLTEKVKFQQASCRRCAGTGTVRTRVAVVPTTGYPESQRKPDGEIDGT